MTAQLEILNDEKYIPILDHGFVGLVDHMGSDGSVVQAARVSYGNGTKKVSEDTALIRYLMRHKHTSPFEMCQIKLHIKIPIFVMRQLVRHRTASLNEYSGRYSVMTDEFYLPVGKDIKPQSSDNKQGRAGELSDKNVHGVKWIIQSSNDHCYDMYKILLGDSKGERDLPYDPYNPENPLFDEDFPGISRELARMVLSVNNYTELYWTQNLHNMFHLLRLRMDPHAQYEIRVLANAIYQHVKKLFPISTQAWEDYSLNSVTLSAMEKELLTELMGPTLASTFNTILLEEFAGDEKKMAEKFKLGVREFNEFKAKWING